MQRSDFDGIKAHGVKARREGLHYFDNPHACRGPAPTTDAQRDAEFAAAVAWWSGWLEEDNGRTERIRRLLMIRPQ